jgi:alpha-1,3-rhamnosyl/mannosyltransferase
VRIGLNALAVTPERPGGVASYVTELTRRCPRLDPGDDWVVFEAPWARPVLGQLPSNVRRVVCRLPHRSIVARVLWEQLALPLLASRQHLDVLFAPVNVAPVAFPGHVVLTLHEAEPFQPDSQIPLPLVLWWRVMRRFSARRASRILTVSEAARQQLRRWMGVHIPPTHVVHLGVDHARFAAAKPATTLGSDPYLLWVGRPYPRKDLGTLLSAFAHLRRQGFRERLVLIGPPGWDEPGLARHIDAEFAPGSVVRMEVVSEAALPGWYAGAAAFVFPSREESFGLPVLEAMASGTPVVASDIDALIEIGGDAPTYFNRGDSHDLARALKTVLTDSASRAVAKERGIARAATFGWETTAAETNQQLRESATAWLPRGAGL